MSSYPSTLTLLVHSGTVITGAKIMHYNIMILSRQPGNKNFNGMLSNNQACAGRVRGLHREILIIKTHSKITSMTENYGY